MAPAIAFLTFHQRFLQNVSRKASNNGFSSKLPVAHWSAVLPAAASILHSIFSNSTKNWTTIFISMLVNTLISAATKASIRNFQGLTSF